jgi:DNA repair protein RadC
MILQQAAEIKVSYIPNNQKKPTIVHSQDAYIMFKTFFSGETICLQEQFAAMYLNRCNRVIGIYKVSIGGMTGTVCDTRLILGVALKTAACSIMLCHNHPSGNLKPSLADEQLTQKIKQAADVMDVKLLDHLIISQEEYYSFADEGII